MVSVRSTRGIDNRMADSGQNPAGECGRNCADDRNGKAVMKQMVEEAHTCGMPPNGCAAAIGVRRGKPPSLPRRICREEARLVSPAKLPCAAFELPRPPLAYPR